MRALMISNLSSTIDNKVVEDLVLSYEALVINHQKGNIDVCLTNAGKFVEHVLRAIEFIRTGVALLEIKSVATTMKVIEKDQGLKESLRILIPRIANAMIYDIRSKRGAVHVKEVDPKHIDASLSVQAASWIMAEFLRLYHVDDETEVMNSMGSLIRGYLPFVETHGDERVVTKKVPCDVELLLLLAQAEPTGLDRRTLGQSSKYSPSSVTRNLSKLDDMRYIHKQKNGTVRITGSGERHLGEQIAGYGVWNNPAY